MNECNARVIPVKYSSTLISVASKLIRVNYPLVMGIVLVVGILAGIGIATNKVVELMTSAANQLLVPGTLLIVADLVRFEKSDFQKLFHAFRDQELFKRLLPLILFNAGYSLFVYFFIRLESNFQFLIYTILGLATMALTYFCIPLITLNKMTFVQSIWHSLDAFKKNWLAFLLLGLMLAAMFVISAVLLFIPLIFFTLPVLLMMSYLTYACVFNHLDLDSLNAELHKRFVENDSRLRS